MVSCDNKENADPLFDKTPTERINARKKELSDLLLSSVQGWKLVYYTDNTQLGGFTHLFKFKDATNVEMASDFDATTVAKKTSEYSIDMGSTVSLVFTTRNSIHRLSDSDNYPTDALEGKGYKGDFQFLYYGQENGQIIFRSNRVAFIELRFVKATAQDWEDLPKNIAMISNVIGAPTRPLYRFLETNNGTATHKFDFNFSSDTRFATSNSVESGSSMSYNIGIAYTPTGIIVDPAVEVGGQKLTEFTYDATTGNFTATGTNNVSATIRYSDKPIVLTDDYKILLEGNQTTVYGYIASYLATAPSNSVLCKSLLNTVNASLPATQKLSRVQFYFNDGANGSYIAYIFNGGKATIYHFVRVVEDSVNKTIILEDEGWYPGSEPSFLKQLDKQLLDPKGLYVKKEKFNFGGPPNTIYTFTSVSNPFRITTYAFQ